MKALIGYTGFVGTNLLNQQQFEGLYNSKNISDIAGKSYDEVICAGAPAAMWIANSKPDEDLAGIQKLITALGQVQAKHVTLISTVAVYPKPNGKDERDAPETAAQLPYGKHRMLLEQFVAQHFSSHTIVRLPGLFGLGLKKNAIYDLIHNNNLNQVDARATYQFYNLAHLTSDIQRARENRINLLNISSEPTTVKEVAQEAFGIEFTNEITTPGFTPAFFDYRSVHSQLWGRADGYLYGKATVLAELKTFVASQRGSR
jgi:nucleoside-diphosphate-sugar epimerase